VAVALFPSGVPLRCSGGGFRGGVGFIGWLGTRRLKGILPP
jgi:hypothetical protein